MSFRLVHRAVNVEVPIGQFVIGRNPKCHLVLDDPLASRMHAAIVATATRAELEDLNSRNGVLLNGQPVKERTNLEHLDRIRIGSAELVFLCGTERETQAPADAGLCPTCGFAMVGTPPGCVHCENAGDRTAAARPVAFERNARPSYAPSDEETRRVRGAELIASIIDKALSLGRFEEAERLLSTQLEALLESLKEGILPSEEQLERATHYALRLAEGLQKPAWIEWVFDAHSAAKRVLSSDTIDTLHDLVRRLHFANLRPLSRYLDVLSERAQTISAAERFLVRRIQGLEAVIKA